MAHGIHGIRGMGQTKEAIRSLRASVDKDPTLIPAWADLASLLEQEGDLKGAEDCYRKMLAQGDATGEVRARLVRLAIKRKDPAGAISLLAEDKKDKAVLLDAMRPADANETCIALEVALTQDNRPTCLLLTRQSLPVLDHKTFPNLREGVRRGGYILQEAPGGRPDLILLASGSEVSLAMA